MKRLKAPGLRTIAALITIAATFTIAVAQDVPSADGIWAHGDTVILFARLNACDAPYRPIQPLASFDGGKTWTETGPRLDSSDFEYFLNKGPELFIAGEDIAEGPSSSPFLLRYSTERATWQQSEIYHQASELLAVAVETKSGKFLAWVSHLELHDDGWSGPIYLHQSQDRGRTWHVVKKVNHVPRQAIGFHFFGRNLKQSGPWRLSRSGSSVEHRQGDGTWQTIKRLPLPIQQDCSYLARDPSAK